MVANTLSILGLSCIYFLTLLALISPPTESLELKNVQITKTLWPPARLGAPTHPISGEHISLGFYKAVKNADKSKRKLQAILHNFLENIQRNLTTSTILNTVVNYIDVTKSQHQLQKLNDLLTFFRSSSDAAGAFRKESGNLFEITKNESSALLHKLRQVPTAHRHLSMEVKSQLTDYFAEMEFFHIMFSDIIDQALEFIVDTMHAMERTFGRYSDIQNDVLHTWKFKRDEWCCNSYMDFLQQWSVQIFKCAAGTELNIAYDVYAMTEVTTMYVLRQLEFRIQRLFNCFLFGGYEIRCRFLKKPEQDFEKLQTKLEELQIYYDIKIQRGRVSTSRHRERRNSLQSDDNSDVELVDVWDKCIPYGFPDTQMLSSLKSCFYFFRVNK